ncbi:hypothetical protein [Ulvibacter antarcticus]|uniref:Lipoprotein n=1 Tax=Ulvibacter antarcticus TaxID=442714 RepID=A0A3L9YF16_9FLAO|nr:hypothetical protein [Ulvibacter antarcticus]RMA58974.1 hypothetical protein BXY75_2356 [Ulvibacter antarcticus]
MKATIKIMTMLLIVSALGSCKKSDDSPSEFVNALSATYNFTNGLNNCTNPNGTGSVLFLKVNYEVSDGLEIKKVLTHIELSGGESDDFEDLTFDDDGNQIERADCFRFGNNTWVDYEIRLESINGIISNPRTVRVDKPTGAS